jgi:quinol-cytochrome oxidoreductase complex cytochrome b subunit
MGNRRPSQPPGPDAGPVRPVEEPSPPAVGAEPPRERKPSGLGMLLLHLHPKMVPEEALALPRTFGLGGVAVLLFLLLALTGALLLLVYEPTPERAYASVLQLTDAVHFGAFVRNLHHWAGNALLLVVVLHLLRVLASGALDPPRRANWLVGLALLLLVVAANFTGYLLPWDQLAYWAVTISTGMLEYVPGVGDALLEAARGGAEIGPRTLSRFFVLHVAIVPLALLLLSMFHFWLVRKAGGVMLPAPPPGQRRRLVPASPHLVVREGVAALVALAALLLLAALVEAPLEAAANPGMSPNPAKAPWYFMGLQELLVHLHPTFAVLVVPLLGLVALVALPSLRGGEPPSGRYFGSPAGVRAALVAAALSLVLTPAAVVADESLRVASAWLPSLPVAVRTGLLPLVVVAALLAGLSLVARRRLGASRFEAAQALFVFLLVGLVLLTVTGVLCRGQGMALTWPWAAGGGG